MISCDFEMYEDSTVDISESVIFQKNCAIRVRKNGCLKIGENVSFNNGCIITCRGNTKIGNHVLFGPNVMVFDHDHNFKGNDFEHEFCIQDITIGNNVWIGANVTILKGSTIGDGAVIGANSVVTGVVEEKSIYTSSCSKRVRKY